MKKIIALWVSASIIGLSSAPATAQPAPRNLARGIKALTTQGSKKALAPRLDARVNIPAAARTAGSAALGKTPTLGVATVRPAAVQTAPLAQEMPALSGEMPQAMHRRVEETVLKATMEENLTYAQIRERVAKGQTARVAERILTYPNESVREGMLRNEFMQVALAGNATAGQLARAADFWRTDLQKSLEALSSLPSGDLKTWVSAFRGKDASVLAFNQSLADVAALGVYGTEKDAALILDFYQKTAATSAEPLAAAAAARALLRLGAKQELTALAEAAGNQSPLWDSVSAYARRQNIPLAVDRKQPASQPDDAFVPVLETLGKVNVMAADPSAEATTLYMNLGREGATVAAAPKAEGSLALPALQLPALELPADAAALQVGAVSVPEGGTLSAPATANGSLTAFQQAAQAAGKNARSTVSFLGRTPKSANENAGVLYGGLPLPALWKNAKKVFASAKKRFASNKPAQNPAAFRPQTNEGLQNAIQRASLYAASFIMGLEVATPVIANIGSSFQLSLSDNILVAVATYLPYSLGAFVSNWLKEKIGRKASMNLGLALMGTGFTAGVTLFGLNGAFVPQPDMWAHFYNILGCITLASTGGVFVHNAVGPMMTDLSKGASDLVLQKRMANTEFSRALGMMASFAFPFISTNVLGMDWSFTFALPIPLVAAAALGINLAKIPNTKPELAPKSVQLPQETQTGKRNRRAYKLTSSIQNNSYIRLFKEEKGVAGLLTGLLLMNAVEMSYNNGFLFLMRDLTANSPYQYLFGLAQYAIPFLIGRHLAKGFLRWFPKHNMTIATLLSGLGGFAALPFADDVYALTASLFLSEMGISTAFTLAFARTAKNAHTQDRVVSLIVASAISCAFGPMLLSNLAETLINMGLCSTADATTAALIGIPSALAVLSSMIFKRIEGSQATEGAAQTAAAPKTNWLKKLINRLLGRNNNQPLGNH